MIATAIVVPADGAMFTSWPMLYHRHLSHGQSGAGADLCQRAFQVADGTHLGRPGRAGVERR